MTLIDIHDSTTQRTGTSRALRLLGAASAALVLVATTGCATKGFVRQSAADERTWTTEQLDRTQREMQGELETVQSEVTRQGEEIDRLDQRDEQISQTAQEALERAQEAGRLARGQFVSETLLSSDELTFGFEQATINEEGKAALAEFAQALIDQNESVFIEIQGHTDASGPDAYNYELGLERAEAVRRHLRAEHNVPLHRMEVISYGETAPIASNDNREGRQKNRRVSLVVLK